MQLIAPNTLLHNRYLAIRLVGSGAMGAVYEAEDQRLGHRVALKHNDPANKLPASAFEREGRLLARLRHPALPSVSDYFSEDGNQFLVMAFIRGDDLGELLKQRQQPFESEHVLAWADQLLDALIYLHSQEPPVIHRDIKPQNLKLNERGQIILLDFGVAKGAPALRPQETGGSIHAFTRQYAPLEQIQGTGTDARSDLYALAATLYHLWTGEAPPDALTRAVAVLAHQPDPLPDPRQLNPSIPDAAAEALLRALALAQADRPGSAADLREQLAGVDGVPQASAPILSIPSTNGDDAPRSSAPLFGYVARIENEREAALRAAPKTRLLPRRSQPTSAQARQGLSMPLVISLLVIFCSLSACVLAYVSRPSAGGPFDLPSIFDDTGPRATARPGGIGTSVPATAAASPAIVAGTATAPPVFATFEPVATQPGVEASPESRAPTRRPSPAPSATPRPTPGR